MFVKKGAVIIRTTENLGRYFLKLGWEKATEQEYEAYRKKVEACNS
jgi:hypothetical protein